MAQPEISELCERVLRANWTEGVRLPTARDDLASDASEVPYAYTAPSPGRYPWQWYWDSCFTAIAWRRFDPARAKAELESLLASQRSDGFIGHTTFWGSKVDWIRLPFYNVRGRSSFRTETIQPPLLAWAWSIAVGDPSSEPGIRAEAQWLSDNRDLEGDGLLWLIQPDESGLDSSPKFEPVWGRHSHATLGFPFLVNRNRRLGFDAARIRNKGGPVLCEVVTNVLWGLSRLSMQMPSITPALIARCWDERAGLFFDHAQPGDIRPRVATWASLAPLALPDLPEEIGRRMVEEHLMNREEFWTAVPAPSVSAAEPAYEPDGGHGRFRRYWRGPTWVNSAWLLWIGLKRLNYDAEASELTRRLRGAVLKEGLREYYDPNTGAGLGAVDFGWSTLINEMDDPDPSAATSYLA